MKLSVRTKKIFDRYRRVGAEVILGPPNRFTIFGEGVNNGLVVQGRIQENCEEYVVLKDSKKFKAKYDPERKVGYFTELFVDTKSIATFHMSSRIQQSIMKEARSLKSTHLRFYRKPDNPPRVRAFDARKYYEGMFFDSDEVEKYGTRGLLKATGDPFYVYFKMASLRTVPKDDFEVTVFDNGLTEMIALKSDHSFILRDQRLGQNFDEMITDQLGIDNVLLFDPRIAPSVRRRLKRQNLSVSS